MDSRRDACCTRARSSVALRDDQREADDWSFRHSSGLAVSQLAVSRGARWNAPLVQHAGDYGGACCLDRGTNPGTSRRRRRPVWPGGLFYSIGRLGGFRNCRLPGLGKPPETRSRLIVVQEGGVAAWGFLDYDHHVLRLFRLESWNRQFCVLYCALRTQVLPG